MECPKDFEKAISSLRNIVSTAGVQENVKQLSNEMNSLLTSENGLLLLKQHPKHLEVVLPIFIRILFNSDRDVAQPSLKHCDAVFDIIWNILPKIKKEGWWKQFETKTLLGLVDSLKIRVEADDDSWVTIWTFVANLVITDKLDVATLNKLLAVTEHAFKKGRERAEIKDKAWVCWKGLISAFGRSPHILVLSKAINLLLKPLLTLSQASSSQISTWVHLIVVKGLSGPVEVVKSIVDPMLKSMYKSGEKSASRTLPDDCTSALIKILSHDHVVQHCLSDFIDVFGACVNSRPSAGLIEQLSGIIVQSINDMKDDGASYKLWKALMDQYSSCSESPILSQACQNIFTDVNFLRWVDSSTIEGKEISDLMVSCEFRDKVLLRSIKALTFDELAETPTKKKSRKGSWEEVWSNYCEAYISWLDNQSPHSPKECEKSEAIQSLKDSCDYQAVQFLLLQPVQLNIWNTAVCKTWFLLCEACHNKKFLHTFVKAIFDALDEPNFQLQKAIDVSDGLYKLDNNFCKQSAKLLDTISSFIFYIEFQSLLDVLSLAETAVLFPEMFSVLCKICKNANEKSSDYDQLNAHKIKTKVGRIMRKIEQHSNFTEKEKHLKAQRPPFRAQSNFLQRLAKAEEKNKTKSPFLASMFSSSEKGKNDIENDGDDDDSPATMDTSQESGVITDENKKPVNHLDDSEIVPIITLPSLLKSTPPKENGNADGMVAEKENLILSAISSANTTSSPTIASPKMKITNAREVKTIDASSPAVSKKLKPIAGQKSTPKKVTPSKVSYFDDDANDCVMVPPKPKTTPLTEHQVEMMSKRRTDIPALYQDLSQDTQSQQVAVVQEVTSGVSPRPVQESQDIVPGTPSPEDHPAASSPEHRKSSCKKSTSAKKLDFNNLCTPTSKTNSMYGSFHETSPTVEHLWAEGDKCEKLVDGILSTKSDESKNEEPPSNGLSSSTKEVKEEPQPAVEGKSKRKRKSEPAKFSPKLTRSKKNLKSRTSIATPDAKLTKLSEQQKVKSADTSAKLSESPEPSAKPLSVKVTDVLDHDAKSARPKSPERTVKMLSVKAPDNLEPVAKLARSQSPDYSAKKLSVEVPDSPEGLIKSKSSDPSNKSSDGVPNVIKMDDTNHAVESKNVVEITPSNGSQETSELRSQCAEECEPSSHDKPKKTWKRKAVEASNDETPKKKKGSDEDYNAAKNSDSAKKKKKKPFKLVTGGNLENWLVKTDRVPTPVLEPEVKVEKVDPADDIASQSVKAVSEKVPNDSVVDLDNSEEIVPSTQESSVENHKSVLPVMETKTDEIALDKEVVVEIMKEHRSITLPNDADNRSPEKPEGSVLDRLSHESPNDDIALVISPSKRQRRAPSVFRGEGDTYLSKDKFCIEAKEEPEDDSKVTPRSKKTASPTSKKRLQPLGGRSAKMLRLATSTSIQEDNDDIVVTPVRRNRRESIVPVKYGENWPKGAVENWVACTPASPYMSPFRSALKRTPGPEDDMTPQRGKNDSMASPLLSSAKRKRVVFLDPPVTRGLAYDMDSPGGSLHHADVPQGSPYPTWKGEDDHRRDVLEDEKMEISPSKRDVERLKSLADLSGDAALREVVEKASPSKHGKRRPESQPDLKSFTPTDVSDEVRQLIDPTEPTTIVPSPELDMNDFQEKFKLSDAFMTTLSETDVHVRSLLMQCFDCANMTQIVDAWKFGDCRRVCQMPHSFLVSVKNLQGEVLTDVLGSGVFTAPTNKLPVQFSESSAQTEQRVENSSQTQTVVFKDADSQTTTLTSSVFTNTEVNTTTLSTQVDAELKLPSVDDWPSISEAISHQSALLYLSDSLRILSSSLPKK